MDTITKNISNAEIRLRGFAIFIGILIAIICLFLSVKTFNPRTSNQNGEDSNGTVAFSTVNVGASANGIVHYVVRVIAE